MVGSRQDPNALQPAARECLIEIMELERRYRLANTGVILKSIRTE